MREPYLSKAIEAVDRLPDYSERKEEFINRVALFDDKYEEKQLELLIMRSVRQLSILEQFYSERRDAIAVEAINSIPDGQYKEYLQSWYQEIMDKRK